MGVLIFLICEVVSSEHVLQRYHSTTLTSGTTCHHSGHMPPLVGHHLADCTQDSSTPEGHQWIEKQAAAGNVASISLGWMEATVLHHHQSNITLAYKPYHAY